MLGSGSVAVSVSSNLYVFAAFGAGVISFVSPCVLPIVPGYLSLITGLSVGEIREQQRHYLKRIAVNTGLFVLGFTIVFVLLGLITTAAGSALFRNQETLTRISGGLVLLMACYLAGSQLLTTPRLYQEFRWQPHLDRFGPVAAPVHKYVNSFQEYFSFAVDGSSVAICQGPSSTFTSTDFSGVPSFSAKPWTL